MIEIPFIEVRKSFVDPSPAWGVDKGDGGIFIRCGDCKKCINLVSHKINDDGVVSPSVHHDEGSYCQWHVHIKLLDWEIHKPKD